MHHHRLEHTWNNYMFTSVLQTSWHFTKLEDTSRQRWFLEHGLGLLRREEWMRLLSDPSHWEALSNSWRLFYCDDAGLLAMVACEAPLLHTGTARPVVLVRDKLRVLCLKSRDP